MGQVGDINGGRLTLVALVGCATRTIIPKPAAYKMSGHPQLLPRLTRRGCPQWQHSKTPEGTSQSVRTLASPGLDLAEKDIGKTRIRAPDSAVIRS